MGLYAHPPAARSANNQKRAPPVARRTPQAPPQLAHIVEHTNFANCDSMTPDKGLEAERPPQRNAGRHMALRLATDQRGLGRTSRPALWPRAGRYGSTNTHANALAALKPCAPHACCSGDAPQGIVPRKPLGRRRGLLGALQGRIGGRRQGLGQGRL